MKKLIEVALPLGAINKASAREKSIRHGHPSTLHLWWARRPLAAARAVIFSQMVDDPSEYVDVLLSDPKQKRAAEREMKKRVAAHAAKRALARDDAIAEPQPTLEEVIAEQERERLFAIIEDLVLWENTTNEEVLEPARAEIRQSWRRACAENAGHPKAAEIFDRHKLPACLTLPNHGRYHPKTFHPNMLTEDAAMEKYKRLGEYLTEQKGDCCTLPFIKIEEIIGGSLPRSARNHRAWWANDKTHPQAQSWMRAGWNSEGPPDFGKGHVRFLRTENLHRLTQIGREPRAVTVRNLDAAVVAGLKQRAQRNGVPLERELRTLLTRASRPGRSELLAEADRIRAMAPGQLTDSVSLLREDRDSR